jgi:hypothetical protein
MTGPDRNEELAELLKALQLRENESIRVQMQQETQERFVSVLRLGIKAEAKSRKRLSVALKKTLGIKPKLEPTPSYGESEAETKVIFAKIGMKGAESVKTSLSASGMAKFSRVLRKGVEAQAKVAHRSEQMKMIGTIYRVHGIAHKGIDAIPGHGTHTLHPHPGFKL